MRRYDEAIDVERRADEPGWFVWRTRLYLVRAVLAHWTEAGRWWRIPQTAAAGLGPRFAGGHGGHDETAAAGLGPRFAEERGVGAPRGLDDREREYWRVEAAAGRTFGTGVYDLCLDMSRGGWFLARAVD
ncbi:MAG: DUF6504 family protein [Frankia sp.]|nr:DUF6504 family protein [Frankia sp.]